MNVKWTIPKDATLTVNETIEVAELATARFIRIYEQEAWGTPPVVQSGGALVVFDALRGVLDKAGRLGDGWTYIVEGDAATLLEDGAHVIAARYYPHLGKRRVGGAYYHGGVWFFDADLTERMGLYGANVYAWREWPQPPPPQENK